MRKAKNREYKVRMRVCSSFKLKYWVSQPRHALWQSGDSLDSVRQSSGRPYLLCVIDKSDANYSSALAVVNRLSALINTYTITQLRNCSAAKAVVSSGLDNVSRMAVSRIVCICSDLWVSQVCEYWWPKSVHSWTIYTKIILISPISLRNHLYFPQIARDFWLKEWE